MIRLKPILTELEKGKWTSVSDAESEKENILALVRTAYKEIGGHPNFNSTDDVTSGNSADSYEIIDLDGDSKIDAVNAVKTRPSGKKFVAIGHDGTSAAKSAAVNRTAELLKKPWWFVEVSGKLKDILIGKGVKPITDEDLVRNALPGKDITWHGDGSYDREIGNEMKTKFMIGRVKK